MKSESIGKLALALSKAQGAIKGASKDSNNPFYKSTYADMDAVVMAIKEHLSVNELAYSQLDGMTSEGKLKITTLIMHSSGEWICGETIFDMIVDPQKRKSAHTLLKRAALTAAVGLSEKDDDGNEAVGINNSFKPELSIDSQKSTDITKSTKLVTDAQLKRMEAMKNKSKLSWEEITKMIKMRFNKSDYKELTMSEYDEVIGVIEANTESKV